MEVKGFCSTSQLYPILEALVYLEKGNVVAPRLRLNDLTFGKITTPVLSTP